MSRFCVTRLVGPDGALKTQMACNELDGKPLTWDTWVGAMRFTEMNGGVVTPITDLTAVAVQNVTP